VRPSTDVCNLGVLFDSTLSLKTHVTRWVAATAGLDRSGVVDGH